ncbi:MAG: Helix-turn-helix domain [Pseudomonadota bacterium]
MTEPRNRLKQVRIAAGWTQGRLGNAVGLDHSAISKIEQGRKSLRADEAAKIAEVLGVPVSAVIGISDEADQRGGFSSSTATTYEAPPGDPFLPLRTQNHDLVRMIGDSLDALQIQNGDILVVDRSSTAIKSVKPLDLVHVQYHFDEANFSKAVSLILQYVPPRLLITNSRKSNQPPINMDAEDAQILGVVVSKHRALQT